MDQIRTLAGYAHLVNEHTSVTDRAGSGSSATWVPAVAAVPTRYSDSSAPRPGSAVPESYGSTSAPKFTAAADNHSVAHAASIRFTEAL